MENLLGSVLVVGGFGYLGARLVDSLSRGERLVVVAGRSPMGTSIFERPERVVSRKILWDDDKSVRAATEGIHTIVNCIGLSAGECREDPATGLLVKQGYTSRLLRAAIDAKVERFINISSVHVYSDTLVGQFDERSPLSNSDAYAVSHAEGERVVSKLSGRHGIAAVNLRVSNGFGPPIFPNNNCWNLLVNDLCRGVWSRRGLVVRSPRNRQIDVIPLSEVCRAIKFLIESPWDSLTGKVLNLCSGTSRSLDEIAETIRQSCLSTWDFLPELVFESSELLSREESALAFSVKRLSALGFEVDANIDSEIRETIAYARRLEIDG